MVVLPQVVFSSTSTQAYQEQGCEVPPITEEEGSEYVQLVPGMPVLRVLQEQCLEVMPCTVRSTGPPSAVEAEVPVPPPWS
jgi:hypothetical protein